MRSVPVPDICKHADVDSVKTSNVHPEVPICTLIVFDGTFNGVPVQILKEDGCHTNIIYTDFVRQLKGRCTLKSSAVTVDHSRDGSPENLSQIIMGGTLRIGPHLYASN